MNVEILKRIVFQVLYILRAITEHQGVLNTPLLFKFPQEYSQMHNIYNENLNQNLFQTNF